MPACPRARCAVSLGSGAAGRAEGRIPTVRRAGAGAGAGCGRGQVLAACCGPHHAPNVPTFLSPASDASPAPPCAPPCVPVHPCAVYHGAVRRLRRSSAFSVPAHRPPPDRTVPGPQARRMQIREVRTSTCLHSRSRRLPRAVRTRARRADCGRLSSARMHGVARSAASRRHGAEAEAGGAGQGRAPVGNLGRPGMVQPWETWREGGQAHPWETRRGRRPGAAVGNLEQGAARAAVGNLGRGSPSCPPRPLLKATCAASCSATRPWTLSLEHVAARRDAPGDASRARRGRVYGP